MQSEEFEDLYELRDILTMSQLDIMAYIGLLGKYGDKYKEIGRLHNQLLDLLDELDELLSEAIILVNEEDNVD
jgi:hypothetical protein